MIHKLRGQFVWITMSMLTSVLLVPLIALNLVTNAMSYSQANTLLEQIAVSAIAEMEETPPSDHDPANGVAPPDKPEDDSETESDSEIESDTEAESPTDGETTTETVEETKETLASEPTPGETESTHRNGAVTTAKNENRTEVHTTTAPKAVTGKTTTKAAKQTTAKVTTKAKTYTTAKVTTKAKTYTTAKVTTKAKTYTTAKVQTTRATQATTQQRQTVTEPVYTEPIYTEPFDPYPPEDDFPWHWHDYYEHPDNECYDYGVESTKTEDSCLVQQNAYYVERQSCMIINGAVVTPQSNLNDDTTQSARDNKPSSKPDSDHSQHETNITIDHFICYLDEDGILNSTEGTNDNITDDECQILSTAVLSTGKTDGKYGKYQFFRSDGDFGTLLVFSDRSAETLLLQKILWVSIIVFLFMEGVVLLLTMYLTKRAMRPMQETFERQRQFISDAGHELKTPLTIISANADILKDEIGDNKWLLYIQSQTERMRTLITDMMNLTKIEMGRAGKFEQFSLSTAVSSAALPFESQAFEQEKKLVLDIQENITYTGNQDQVKQLLSIFIDNAIKYSDDHGTIRVTLQQVRDKRSIQIFNTGQGVTEEEKQKIFERFYRSDSSRARQTGGYGLGLSIAQSIAESHRIKIQVDSEYGKWICFTLNL